MATDIETLLRPFIGALYDAAGEIRPPDRSEPWLMSKPMRSRPDREDYAFITVIVVIAATLWFAYSYQACGPAQLRCVFDGLKEWQDLIGGIMTVVAAFIGGYYVIRSTTRQVEALSSQFRETVRPYVIARLTTRAGVLFVLEIENIGQSPASNLNLGLDRDFYQFNDRLNLREASAFNRTIPHFSPGEKISFDLSQGFNLNNMVDGVNRTPHQFMVGAEYHFGGYRYHETYLIDLDYYFQASALKHPSDHLDDISKGIQAIAKNTKK